MHQKVYLSMFYLNIYRTSIRSTVISAVFITLIISVLPVDLMAQSESDTLSVVLEEVKIEATHSSITIDKASISVSTLSRSIDDIVSRPAATMNELTFTLPGIWISNRENHALGERMTVRGMGWRSQFGVRGIQVVLDDIPLTVADGQTIMNMIDPAMVQSIELLRGPSATFWGNSSGGVLYMRTRMPQDSPNFMFRSYLGSYNTMKQEARWHDRVGNVRMSAYGSYFDTDGYRDHSAAQLIRGGISAGFDMGENSNFEARIAYSGMPDAEHPGSLPLEESNMDPTMAWPNFQNTGAGKDFQQLMASGSYIQQFNEGLLNISSHYTFRDLNNPLPFGIIMVNRHAGGSRATYDFENLPFQLQIGAEFKWQRDDRKEADNVNGSPGNDISTDQTDNVGNQALFSKAVFDMNRSSFSIGLRADRMAFSADDFIENEEGRRIFTSLNPSAGFNINLGSARLFTNFSTSFESPTTTEFKNRPGGRTGFNPDLRPERTIGLESGVRGYFNSLQAEYDLALFGLRVSDLIIPFEEEDGGPTLFRNEGKTTHYGFESHFRLHPADLFSLEFMYTWLQATFSDGEFEGNEIPGVAPHRFGSTFNLYLGDHVLSADTEWIGTYFTDSANSAVNDSYFLLNGRWTFNGLTFDGWKVQPFFSVYNILDVRYNTSVSINAFGGRYYEPGSGRNFQGGISIQI